MRTLTTTALVFSSLLISCEGSDSVAQTTRPGCCIEGQVRGIADLHTHPAVHRTFGGNAVALSPEGSRWQDSCDAEGHAGGDSNLVRRAIRSAVLSLVSQNTNHPHGPYGARAGGVSEPRAWPHGADILHQQMSEADLRAAYEAGLRLLFAATLETQSLTALMQGYDWPAPILPSRAAEFETARRQIEEIRRLVARNASWMEIVLDPAAARAAICAGKLAIVLSAEMDALSIEQAEELHSLGVRHMTVVHVADNDVGGAGVYTEIFNAHTHLMSSVLHPSIRRDGPGFFGVVEDESLEFRLSDGMGLRVNLVLPDFTTVPSSELRDFGYVTRSASCDGPDGPCGVTRRYTLAGHRNACGLRRAPEGEPTAPVGCNYLERLAALPMMIDLAHASSATTREIMCWAGRRGLPVMNSHSGIRRADRVAGSERDMRAEDAVRMVALGGVLGIGTGGELDPRPALYSRTWDDSPLDELEAGTVACWAAGGAAPHPGCSASEIFALEDDPRAGEFDGVSLTLDIGSVRPDPRGSERTVELDVIVELSDPRSRFGADATVAPRRVEHRHACRPDAPCLITVQLGCNPDERYHSSDLASLEVRVRTEGADIEIAGGYAELISSAGGEDRIRLEVRSTCLIGPRSSGPAEDACDGLPRRGGALRIYSRLPLSVDEAPRTSFVRLQVGVGGAGFDAPLRGASAYGEGSELCARLWGLRGGECAPVGVEGESSGRRCPPDWTSVNLAGSLGASTVVDRFLELQGDAVPPICGLELLLQARDVTPAALPITSVRVDTLADPIERFVAEYAEILADLRADASEPSPIALGTDFNGLARRFPFTALRDEARAPGSLLRAGGCDWEAPSVPSPWSFHRRGWATYGGLADLLSALQRVPGQGRRVVDELFSSAEAVLRFWERAIERGRCMPGSAGCPRCAEVVDDCRRLAGAGDCAGAQEPPICDPEIEE